MAKARHRVVVEHGVVATGVATTHKVGRVLSDEKVADAVVTCEQEALKRSWHRKAGEPDVCAYVAIFISEALLESGRGEEEGVRGEWWGITVGRAEKNGTQISDERTTLERSPSQSKLTVGTEGSPWAPTASLNEVIMSELRWRE